MRTLIGGSIALFGRKIKLKRICLFRTRLAIISIVLTTPLEKIASVIWNNAESGENFHATIIQSREIFHSTNA